MKANPLFLLEFILFDFGAVAFGVWQWWTVRPRKDDKPPAPPTPSEQGPGHPEG